MTRFAVGIDLGTTNSAMAYVDLEPVRRGKTMRIETFRIPQPIDVEQWGDAWLFPSVLYLPGEHELPPAALNLPWGQSRWLVGEGARKQGGRVPGRLVASAKSWLCHSGVDRRAAILPWNADEEVDRISPVAASAAYLAHLRDAWNHLMAREDESLRLEQQKLVITVPASFDEVARDFTVEAAREAGLGQAMLLEEPQAAFYGWLEGAGAKPLAPGSVAVVVDCGGGTTDFSLIAVVERQGQAQFERLAVGDHLLLGGDNMDIALARHVEQLVSPNRRLDPSDWSHLVQVCRRTKEEAFGPDPPDQFPITLMGRGSKVVGGMMRATLDRSTIERLTLDGFFPMVGFGEEPLRGGQAGLAEFGLPFVAEPAITRHLAHFLRLHGPQIAEVSADGSNQPTAILFNGGVFNGAACQRQVLTTLQSWFGGGWNPEVLSSASLDLAVARGAAYHAAALETGNRRIRSGAARGYYLGIDPGDRSLGPGQQAVICLVPHGLEEGRVIRLDEPSFELQLGEPVAFPLLTSSIRTKDFAGQILTVDPGQLAELPPLATVLRGGRRAGNKKIGVRLEAKLTEVGTLELYLAAREGDNRWRLQFTTRSARSGVDRSAPADATSGSVASSVPVVSTTYTEEELAETEKILTQAFASNNKADLESLPKRLESAIGLPRHEWPTGLLRRLWETLSDAQAVRTRSAEAEARWLNLAGFFLRPGWGDPLDSFRVEQLWRWIGAGPVHAKVDRVWSEYWIVWRRVAGGLDAMRQNELTKRLVPQIDPSTGRRGRRTGPAELAEAWRAIAALEWLSSKVKSQLGDILLHRWEDDAPPSYVSWALTRLGSRQPLYGPANLVVSRTTAERWINHFLNRTPETDRERVEFGFVIAQLSRMTGDRARDIDDDLRQDVLKRLDEWQAPPEWITMVRTTSAIGSPEAGRLLGDTLPPGLRLAAADTDEP